jgi:hypothetical protein
MPALPSYIVIFFPAASWSWSAKAPPSRSSQLPRPKPRASGLQSLAPKNKPGARGNAPSFSWLFWFIQKNTSGLGGQRVREAPAHPTPFFFFSWRPLIARYLAFSNLGLGLLVLMGGRRHLLRCHCPVTTQQGPFRASSIAVPASSVGQQWSPFLCPLREGTRVALRQQQRGERRQLVWCA